MYILVRLISICIVRLVIKEMFLAAGAFDNCVLILHSTDLSEKFTDNIPVKLLLVFN